MLYVGFESTKWDWRPMIWAVAIASMVVGAVLGLTQTDVKRILAYSSIAHAGFILVGVMALDKDGLSSTMFYLLTYGFTTIAAFGVVTLVRNADGEATHLSQWSGLAKKSPIVATVFTILLMSMAGIPLTAGFTGKFFVFRAGYHDSGRAGRHRPGRLGDRRLLLPAHRRPDVLRRPARRWPDRRHPRAGRRPSRSRLRRSRRSSWASRRSWCSTGRQSAATLVR